MFGMEIQLSMLIVGFIVVSPLLFVIFTSLEFYFNKSSRARREYKNARGTIHKNFLKKGSKNLNREIQRTKKEYDSAIQVEKKLNSEKNSELEIAATVFVFETGFTSIPGIGKVLKERVRRRCFDGTLQSLNRAWGVHGIGESKAYEIRSWVERTKRRLPSILKGDFPNKQKIVEKYDELIKKANDDITNIESTLKPMIELENTVKQELDNLNSVTSSTFRKSYDGDMAANNVVTLYHLGCFPEWKRIPIWFKTLMEAYG